jgi:predicted Zn-dependent peptidase
MMFQGSENVGKTEHFSYIQKAGGTLNGTTNQDRTNYFETVPSNQLELVLWLESDRMSTLNVTQENFDNQREVVKEEKRQRYDNVPYGSRFYNLFSRAYKQHPYRWIPIGSMQDLNDADLNYAKNFYSRFYAPNNAVLVIAGDIEYDNAKSLVKKYFSSLKPSQPGKNGFPEIKYNGGEVSDIIYDNIKLPSVYIGYKIPGVHSADSYPLEILSNILTDGRSSRLYKNIVYENKLAKSISSFTLDMELGGLFIISATGYPGTNLEDMKRNINAQINQIKSEFVTDEEILKAKNKIENNFTNRAQTMMGIADRLAYYWTYFKKTDMINTELNNYLELTAGDITKVCEKYLKDENRVVLYYLPEKK